MSIKQYRTGNSVADYRVRQIGCEACHGEGLITVDKDALREFVNSSTLCLSEVKDVIRRWNSTQTIICDACNGMGSVESWV